MPQDLDNQITSHLPSAWLFKPSDVMAGCPGVSSLQAAVTGACTWPTYDTLRGRFIFVFTGGDVSSSGTVLNTYVSNGSTTTSRMGFIAPNLTSTSGISAKQYVIFFNMESAYASLATSVHLANFVGRVWGVNDSTTWSNVVKLDVNHIATDKVNYHQDPWAVTHNSLGWPFQCLDGWLCGSNQTGSSERIE